MNSSKTGTKRIAALGVFTALSVMLVALIHFPIFPAVSFLEYDPADIPILIVGFAFGPAAGLIVTAIAALIQGFTVSAASGVYGVIMHVLATGVYVLVSSLVYRRHRTRGGAAASLALGTAAMVAMMFLANLVVTPYFIMGALNGETVRALMGFMPFILLFNLIKAGVNGLVTFLIYKSISRLISRLGVTDAGAAKPKPTEG